MNAYNLPKSNQYDGDYKQLKIECGACEFFRRIPDKRANHGIPVCALGVAYKILVEPDRLKHCEILSRGDLPDNTSFLDYIIAVRKGKIPRHKSFIDCCV
jgi:hypothetical protein